MSAPVAPPLEPLVLGLDGARALLVLGHGAGAGMRHLFMDELAEALAARGIATVRYEFPYVRAGSGRPDPEPVLVATVAEAVRAARALAPTLPLFAGGKSMGGRMTTRAAAGGRLADLGVRGFVLVGFPLHPPKKPGTSRADHLTDVAPPMLFLAGTRDQLSDLALLRGVLAPLAPRARLDVMEGADHGFALLVRHRTPEPATVRLATTIAAWVDEILASPSDS